MRNEENICQYCMRPRAITTLSLNACLNQMNWELSYLLTNYIKLGPYCKYHFYQVIFQNIQHLFISAFQFQYFVLSSFAWYLTVFCNQFVFKCFAPNIRLLLKTRTLYVVDFTVLTNFALDLDSVKLSQ